MKYTTFVNGEQFEVEIQRDGSVLVNGKRYEIDFLPMEGSLHSIIMDNRSLDVAIEEQGSHYEILMQGRLYDAQVLDQRAMLMLNRKGGLKMGSGEVHAPMPGLIVDITVNVGDEVTMDDTVVILESMKMQNELKAPRAGKVQTISVTVGDSVDKNQLLIIIAGAEE